LALLITTDPNGWFKTQVYDLVRKAVIGKKGLIQQEPTIYVEWKRARRFLWAAG